MADVRALIFLTYDDDGPDKNDANRDWVTEIDVGQVEEPPLRSRIDQREFLIVVAVVKDRGLVGSKAVSHRIAQSPTSQATKHQICSFCHILDKWVRISHINL